MVGKGRIAPYPMLDPEGRMRQRIVLLRCTEVEPDARQAMNRLKLGAGDVLVIVPQQPTVPGGLVRCERRKEKRHANQPGWPPARLASRTNGRLLRRARSRHAAT